MSALPPVFHELVVAPVALLLAARHAARALGAARAAVELGALLLYGFSLERVAISLFSAHDYGTVWRLAPAGVPVAVAVVWAALIISSLALSARLGWRRPLPRAAGAAVLALALDLMMEPLALRAGLWRWTPPGAWLGVPIGNFVGWTVIVGAYAWGAERWSGGTTLPNEAASRLALAAGSVLALVLVGYAWKMSRAEWLFDARTSWLVWGVLLSAAAGATLRTRAPGGGATLAGRLGEAPGLEPVLVFAWLMTAFAADAALLADPTHAAVALGSVLALAPALRAGARAA